MIKENSSRAAPGQFLDSRLERYVHVLACPECRGSLRTETEAFVCEACSTNYPDEASVPVLLSTASKAFARSIAAANSGLPWANSHIQTALAKLPRPEDLIKPRTRAVIERAFALMESGVEMPFVVNVGSGGQMTRDYVLNIDLERSPQADVVADALDLPFQDNSLDGIILDNVLEHVVSPVRAVSEALRTLRPGGIAFAVSPFLYEYHPVPTDYWRFACTGLRALFWQFEAVEMGAGLGPTETFLPLFANYLALVLSFGSHSIYRGARRALALALSPLAVLDRVLLWPSGTASYTASSYLIARKPLAGGPLDPRLVSG